MTTICETAAITLFKKNSSTVGYCSSSSGVMTAHIPLLVGQSSPTTLYPSGVPPFALAGVRVKVKATASTVTKDETPNKIRLIIIKLNIDFISLQSRASTELA